MTEPEAPEPAPLVLEAAKKAQIIWVSVDDADPRPLWCTWLGDSSGVVCGGGEQRDPGLGTAESCRVIARGDHGGRIVEYDVTVEAVTASDPDWEPTTTALAAKRLNSVGDTVERWAAESGVYKLRPLPDQPRHGAQLPRESLAASPVDTPAARPTRKPYRLHKVRRRAK